MIFVTALCDSVAQKLIEDGKVFLQMIVQAMGKSNPHDVRIEGFRLAQCLLVRVIVLYEKHWNIYNTVPNKHLLLST